MLCLNWKIAHALRNKLYYQTMPHGAYAEQTHSRIKRLLVMEALTTHWKDCYWSSSTLATWCHLIGKDLDAGKDWGQEEKQGDRGWDGWMASHSVDMNLSKLQEIVEDRGVWSAIVHGVTKRQTLGPPHTEDTSSLNLTRLLTTKAKKFSILHIISTRPRVL